MMVDTVTHRDSVTPRDIHVVTLTTSEAATMSRSHCHTQRHRLLSSVNTLLAALSTKVHSEKLCAREDKWQLVNLLLGSVAVLSLSVHSKRRPVDV